VQQHEAVPGSSCCHKFGAYPTQQSEQRGALMLSLPRAWSHICVASLVAFCSIAEALNRKLLEVLLAQAYPDANILSYPDVLQLPLGEPGSLLPKVSRDITSGF